MKGNYVFGVDHDVQSPNCCLDKYVAFELSVNDIIESPQELVLTCW